VCVGVWEQFYFELLFKGTARKTALVARAAVVSKGVCASVCERVCVCVIEILLMCPSKCVCVRERKTKIFEKEIECVCLCV